MSHYEIVILVLIMTIATRIAGQEWIDAHATFYGDSKGGQADQGACGYETMKEGYGTSTTALSVSLFHNGSTCGSCYEIKCTNSEFCIKDAPSIVVTATNLCPASTGTSAWCNPPLSHFDLTMAMFLKIAQYKAGIVPVQFRKVACSRQGGVRFMLSGNPNWLLALVFNVAGAGDVTGMKVKGSGAEWVSMSRNWGMKWQGSGATWSGQALSFQVSVSDGKMLQFDNVVPSTWQEGQTFEANSNF